MKKSPIINIETLDVTQACFARAVNHGEVYFHQLDKAITKQIVALEGRIIGVKEFEMFCKRADRAEPNKTGKWKKKKWILFTTILWKERPIVEVEFSDYFYIKLLSLDNQKQIT